MNLPIQKFSNDASSEEFLKMAVVLYTICLRTDIAELNRFVVSTSKVIGADDFNKLVRRVSKMLGDKKSGDNESLCSDWLVESLYELYRSIGI